MPLETIVNKHIYLSEGTPGYGVSSHKSALATMVIGVDVEPRAVFGPEPDYPTCENLTRAKFVKFHDQHTSQNVGSPGIVYEWVADVTGSYGAQGRPFTVQARKEKGIKARDGMTKQDNLVKRITSRMSIFGHGENVVHKLEAGLALGKCDYDNAGVVGVIGVVTGYLNLFGNPLADAGFVREYVEQSPLGEIHYDKLPMCVDVATLAVFLVASGYFNRYHEHKIQDMIVLPGKVRERRASEIDDRMKYYKSLGRLSSDAEQYVRPDLLVGLLDISFNFPDPMVHAMLGAINNAKPKPGELTWRDTIRFR